MGFLNIAQSVDRQTSIDLYANPWQGWFSNLDLGFQAGWPQRGPSGGWFDYPEGLSGCGECLRWRSTRSRCRHKVQMRRVRKWGLNPCVLRPSFEHNEFGWFCQPLNMDGIEKSVHGLSEGWVWGMLALWILCRKNFSTSEWIVVRWYWRTTISPRRFRR